MTSPSFHRFPSFDFLSSSSSQKHIIRISPFPLWWLLCYVHLPFHLLSYDRLPFHLLSSFRALNRRCSFDGSPVCVIPMHLRFHSVMLYSVESRLYPAMIYRLGFNTRDRKFYLSGSHTFPSDRHRVAVKIVRAMCQVLPCFDVSTTINS